MLSFSQQAAETAVHTRTRGSLARQRPVTTTTPPHAIREGGEEVALKVPHKLFCVVTVTCERSQVVAIAITRPVSL